MDDFPLARDIPTRISSGAIKDPSGPLFIFYLT